jgi:hypothetical protein
MLVPDIPSRFVDAYGVQRYHPGQSGYYKSTDLHWEVNQYGWLGASDTEEDTLFLLVGDSFIENLLNPRSCNQGNLLKAYYPSYGFFEAARSGVTLIEALKISAEMDSLLDPTFHLIYASSDDFVESISNVHRYSDRMQVNLDESKLLPGKLKSPQIKKILYNVKLLYYLYLRFPIFVEKQNKNSFTKNDTTVFDEYENELESLFKYCSNNYDLSKTVFIFHPGINDQIVQLANEYGIHTFKLVHDQDENWGFGKHDGHWSCYGQQEVASRVSQKIKSLILDVKSGD